MIFLPIYIIGVILIIVGSIIQIKESSKEKSLSVSNSVHANKKIIVSSIVIAITLGYLSLQALEVYKAYSGMNESRREAENAAAAAQKRAEEGQVNKVDGNTPTSYQFH